ncbi:hypothetical protein [Macrococcus equi]|uniref:hypothetical protein n=1 Tax=Macrococcus equi TaxID=3395462 RepID=UPI0039BE8308
MKKIVIMLAVLILALSSALIAYNHFTSQNEVEIMKEKLKLEKLKQKQKSETAKEKIKKMKDEKPSIDESSNENVARDNSTQEIATQENYNQDNTSAPTNNKANDMEDPSQPSETRTECIPSVMSITGCVYVTPEEYGPAMAKLEAENQSIEDAE